MKRVGLTLLLSLFGCVCWSQQTDFAAGDEDLRLLGGSSGDGLGATGAVAAGDLNDDGIADIIVGAPYADGPNGADAGAAYVIFSSGSPAGTLDVSGAAGSAPDVIIHGASAGDHLTLGAGILVLDVNGDTIDDLVLIAQDADGPADGRLDAGEAYVILGGSLPAVIDLGAGAADTIIYGATAGDVLGRDGAHIVHDFNADNAPDLLLGSYLGDGPGNSRNAAGDLYVVYGGASLPAVIDFNAGDEDVVIYGAEQGDSLTRDGALAVGDLNDDGTADLIIGAEHAEGPENRRHQAGEAYVIFGGATPPAVFDFAAGDFDVQILGASAGDNLTDGGAVHVGDINDDDIDDLVVGASFADGPAATRSDAGEVYVIYGGSSISPLIDLDLNEYDIVIFGADAGDRLGGDGALAVADFDGDGTDDIAVAAIFADGPNEERPQAGEAYIFLGLPGLPKVLDLATDDQDTIIYGASAADFLGRDHALAAGDFDGDGRDDLILAAYGADGPAGLRPESGEGYIIGGLPFFPRVIDFARHEQDVLFYSGSEDDQLGFGPGIFSADINNDGMDDLIIGSPLADGPGDGRTDAGEVLVVLGDAFPPVLEIAHVNSPQTATIGDVLTYTFQIDVKDGQISDVTVTDQLPMGLDFIPGSVAVTAGNGGMTTGFVDEATNVVSVANILAVTLSLDNPADGDFGNDFFTLSFDVLVANSALNQNTDLKINFVAASNQVVAGISTAELTIVEPELEVVSELLSPLPALDLDAGDEVRCRVTLRHAGTSLTDAYEVDLSTTLDAGSGQLLFASLDSVTPAGNAVETATTSAIGSSLTGMFDIPLSGSVVIEFTATVQNSVIPGRNIDAVSDLVWTSQVGADANERDGSGVDANDYIALASSTIGISDRPRVLHTQAPANLTVGETAHIQLRVDLIEGTTTTTTLTDTLPDGIAFLPGTLSVNLFGPSMTTDFVDEATSLNINGQVMTIDFGTVLNPSDNDSSNDFILVDFDIQVLNEVGNQNGDNKTNMVVISDGVLSFQSDSTITLREPELTISKVITSPNPAADVDAGDTVTYEVTIGHGGGSTSSAFDVAFTDLVDGGIGQFLVTNIVSTTPTGGVSILNPVTITGNGTGVAADFDIPLGESVVIVFEADVDETVNPAQVLRNDAAITWNSLKGNPSESRDGDDGVGGALDDYAAISSPAINVESLLSVVHSVAPAELTIGETGSFEIEVTVVEGTTANLQMVNTFPDMDFVAGSLVVNLAVNMSSDYVDEATSSTTAGNILGLNFGNLVNLPDGNPDNDTFTISFDATLANIAGNQNGDVNTNQVTVSDGNVTDSDSADFDILEPELVIDNSLVPAPGANMDAGDILNFFVTISHGPGSTADAHDVVFSELIDGGSGHILITNILNTIVINGSQVSIPTAITGGGTGISGTYEIPLGGSMEVSFQAVVQETVQRTQAIASDAEVRWTSLPGNPSGERSSGGGVDDYFASESEPTVVSSQLDVAHTSAPGTMVIGEVAQFTTTVSLIEGITPGVLFTDTLPVGLTYVPGSLSVTHDAPGMSSAFGSEAADLSIVPGGFTIFFGTVTNPSDNNASNDTITVSFNLTADNIAGNQNTVDLVNSVAISTSAVQTDDDSHTVTIDEPELDIAVEITSDPATDVDSADVITYQITIDHGDNSTADAFDVVFSGLVDNGSNHLLIDSIASVDPTNGATVTAPVTIGAGNTTLSGEFDIPEGASVVITYDAIVQSTVQPRQTLNTSADIRWSSLNGPVIAERTGTGGLNDYAATGLRATVVDDRPTVLHINPPTSASVGAVFAYELELTVIEGSTPQLTLINTLPTAHDLVPGSISVTLNAPGMTSDYVDENTSTSRVGQEVTFDFGDVFNPADNNPANDTITITFDVVALNQALNQNGFLKTNIASAYTQAILDDVDEFENLVVVEPALTLTNEKTAPAGNLNQNIGDTIDYRVFIEHDGGTSTADAFEANIVNTLASNDGSLLITSIDSTVVSGGATILTAANGIGSSALQGTFNVPQGGTVEITFTATVQASMQPGQSLDADGVLTWSSISGTGNAEERDGSGGINDYRIDVTATSTAAQPEIVVIGNGNDITDGQTATSGADFTDFGDIRKGTAGPTRSFFVRNDGDGPLNLGTISVPSGFALLFGLPAQIAANGGSATFTVQLDSSQEGTATGNIVIPADDVDEPSFTFAITGHVKTPDITVEGSGNDIPNNNTSIDVADGTDFGIVRLGDPQVTHTFLVRNDGDDFLSLGTVSLPAGFSLIEPLSGPLLAGASDSFTVQLNTGVLGDFDGNITFNTDDIDETPFAFRIRGVVSRPEIRLTGGASNNDIASGSPASTANGTDLGLGVQGSPGPRTILTVHNDGATPLAISSLTIPNSFTLIDGLPASIPGNSSDTITIELQTSNVGAVGGNVIILNDDDDESTFTFGIAGDVQPAPPVSLSIAGSPFGENREVATITATMAQTSLLPVTAVLSFSGTAAAGDYSIVSSQVVIPPGQLSGSTSIVGIRDGVPEPDETVIVDIATVINGQENGVQQVVAFLLDQASSAQTIYVDSGATGDGSGTSWTNAFTGLNDALSAAQPGDEIWVAGGTYVPGIDRTASFTIANGTTVLGGFAGGETLASQRNPSANITTLSGEIGAPGNADNCYHVVWASGLSTPSTLDGFVITGGNANGAGPHSLGAGIYASNSSLIVASTTVANNSAQVNGGGLWQSGGALSIDTTIWQNNSAGASGGAIHHVSGTLAIADSAFSNNTAVSGGSFSNAGDGATITDTTFSNDNATNGGNIAITGSGAGTVAFSGGSYGGTTVTGDGGSVHVSGGDVSFANADFANAHAANGGAIQVTGGLLTLSDSDIDNSSASVWGGAINVVGGSANITGGELTNNSAATGGAIYLGSASLNVAGTRFHSNSATNGADFASGGSGNSVIAASRFTNNGAARSSASGSGGALYLNSGNNQLLDSIIESNTANSGGGVYIGGGNNIITNATIVANSASNGAGVYVAGGNTSLNNSIVWGNIGANIQIASGTLNVGYSAIQGSGGSGSWNNSFGTNTGGNIDVDPGFTNFAGGDYRLLAVSPGVDAGNNNVVSTTVDLDNKPRRADDLNTTDSGIGGLPPVDMGAYETTPSPLATIGDYVWLDENGDGIQQNTESGVQGISFNLLTAAGSFIKSTVSDATGFYQFGDLLAGSFIVEVDPDGRAIAPQNNGNDALDSDFDPFTFRSDIVTIVASEQQGSVDVGLGTGLVDVFWVFPQNVTVNANSLTKTSAESDLWRAGAISSEAIDNNGFVQTTANETNTLRAIGLGDRDHTPNLNSIEYALVLHNSGQLQVFENGSGRGTFGTYTTGDILRVQVSGDVVSYWRNLDLLYTSTTPVPVNKRPLYVDTAMNTLGSTLENVRIGAQRPVINDFRAGDPDGDNPAYSDGDTLAISFNIDTNMPGAGILDKAGVDSLFNFSHNIGSAYQGEWISARTFQVTVTSTAGQGGVTIGATTVTPAGGVAIADASGGSPRANATSPVLAGSFAAFVPETVPIDWISFDPNIDITNGGSDVQKLDTGGWDANAHSSTVIESGPAIVEATIDEIDKIRAFGLNKGAPSIHYQTIDFAFLLRQDKLMFIYENGVVRGSSLPYFSGDVLRIEIVGNQAVYKRNGFTIYTSTETITAANYPLFVDAALHSQFSTFRNVRMSPAAPQIERFYVGDPDNSSAALDNGDTLTILFDMDTDQPGGAGVQDQAAVDALFNFSSPIGASYTGSWTAPDAFTIVVNSVAGSGLALGATTVTPSQLPPIIAAAGSAPASGQSPSLEGDFGEALPIGVPVVWTEPVNVSVRDNTLIQIAGGAAGAIGQAQFPFGDAWVESEVVETTKRRTFGFGDATNNSAGLVDIKFGLIMTSAALSVIENGSSVAGLGSYNTGDRLRVQITGSQIHYLVNGQIRHTSTKTVTAGDFPLRVESALEEAASTLFEVRRSGINGARGAASLASGNALSGAVIDSVAVLLSPGWNLISLPVDPIVKSPQDVFTLPQQSIVIGEVLGFQDGEYVSVDELTANAGYWVYLPGDTARSFAVTGTVPSSVELSAGWNLIGVSVPTAVPDTINRGAISSFADGVYSGLHDDDAFPLKPTVGYWIHADFPHTLSW